LSIKKKTEESTSGKTVSVWEMIRDVLIASMNKGQFPLALVSLIVVTLILKMPSDDVSKLVFSLIEKLESGVLVTNLMLIASLGGWFFHAKYQRRIITVEIERLSEERTALQYSQIGNRVKSSKGE